MSPLFASLGPFEVLVVLDVGTGLAATTVISAGISSPVEVEDTDCPSTPQPNVNLIGIIGFIFFRERDRVMALCDSQIETPERKKGKKGRDCELLFGSDLLYCIAVDRSLIYSP